MALAPSSPCGHLTCPIAPQVEADIKPFRGLLLGLFFCSTGSSINMAELQTNWPTVGWLVLGLITIKTGIMTGLGPIFGLTKAESIRTGFMLSQGGEFAFVLLSLANSYEVRMVLCRRPGSGMVSLLGEITSAGTCMAYAGH